MRYMFRAEHLDGICNLFFRAAIRWFQFCYKFLLAVTCQWSAWICAGNLFFRRETTTPLHGVLCMAT